MVGRFELIPFYKELLRKGIQHVNVPSKVAFFGWEVAHWKILTVDDLIKMRKQLEAWKLGKYLIIHCWVCGEVCYRMLTLFSISLAFPRFGAVWCKFI